MTLFSNRNNQHHRTFQNQRTQKVIIIKNQEGRRQPTPRSSASVVDLRQLSILCHNADSHLLPLRMQFTAMTKAKDGRVMGVYECSRCGRQQGHVVDQHNPGRSFCLVTGSSK